LNEFVGGNDDFKALDGDVCLIGEINILFNRAQQTSLLLLAENFMIGIVYNTDLSVLCHKHFNSPQAGDILVRLMSFLAHCFVFPRLDFRGLEQSSEVMKEVTREPRGSSCLVARPIHRLTEKLRKGNGDCFTFV